MAVGPEDLRSLSNDEDSIIGIEKSEEIVSVRDDVTTWTVIVRYGINLHRNQTEKGMTDIKHF